MRFIPTKVALNYVVMTVMSFVPVSFSYARDYGLEKIIKASGIPESHLSLYATHTNGIKDEVVLDINSKKLYIPASISKLVTTLGVLKAFPPGHKFKTQLWTSGNIDSQGTLNGILYLKGGGDPSFTSENMWYLVNYFIRTGIKKIEGDIVVDDSLFDSTRFDESRQSERVDRAYDAPVGAMSFNWNSVNIFVRPGKKKGDPGQVYLDPENDYTVLENLTKTVEGKGESIGAERKVDKKSNQDILVVTGKIGLDAPERTIYKNITHPDLWAGENLKSFLGQRGIKITGVVRNGQVPDSALMVAESESKSIQDILADMNKFSNNYVAEMLTKNIASTKTKPASLELGMKMINDSLAELEIPQEQYKMQNPSGLTRDNRISSFAMWKVIHAMKDDFRIYPEMLTSLPIAGVDGTLKKRMKDSPAERWVRAKTGFLTGVVALAGYAGRRDGSTTEFVFIFNGSADEAKVRSVFDKLLVALVK